MTSEHPPCASEAVRQAHAAYLTHERRVDVQQALFPPSIEEGLTGETIPGMVRRVSPNRKKGRR